MDGGHEGLENPARAADLHFLFPGRVYGAVTQCSVEKPAKFSGFEFPGRTCLFAFIRAFFNRPAGFFLLGVENLAGKQKKDLTFHMGRNGAPALLITVNRF